MPELLTTPSRLSLSPVKLNPDQSAPRLPPPAVALILASKPVRTSKETRRDLATSYRAFKTAWSTLEQCKVLSDTCRRLGERAAIILHLVSERLAGFEREEGNNSSSLSTPYEFVGSKGGSTVFKIQSVLIDVQSLATDFSAATLKDRQLLLVQLDKSLTAFRKITASLLACTQVYDLSLSTTEWAEEDASDLAQDQLALPRLFQLSIALRGPAYDAFVSSDPPSPGDTSKRREEFIEYCYTLNPILRPDPSSPSAQARRKWSAPSPTTPPASPQTETSRRLSALPDSPTVIPRRWASENGSNGFPILRSVSGSNSSVSALGVVGSSTALTFQRRASSPIVVRSSSPSTPESSLPTSLLDSPPLETPPSPTPLPSAELTPKLTNEDHEVEDEDLMEDQRRKSGSEVSSVLMSPSSSVDSTIVVTPVETVVAEEAVEAPVLLVEEVEVKVDEGTITEKGSPTPAAATDEPIVALPVDSETATTPTLPSPAPPPELSSDPDSLSNAFAALDFVDAEANKSDASSLEESRKQLLSAIPEDTTLSLPPPTIPSLTLRPATPITRPSTPTPTPTGPRVLCLDGGGLRGLPLLYTLRSALPSSQPPCEQFDLITGVGTGGLVAVLLGRMRLDLDSAIGLYESIARLTLYGKEQRPGSFFSKLFGGGGDATPVNGGRDVALGKACETFLPSGKMRMKSVVENGKLCKTGVLAFEQVGRGAVWSRSFAEEEEGDDLSVRDTVCATLATSSFFKPHRSTSTTFVSTSSSLNPSDATLNLLRQTFPSSPTPSLFLSIGIGRISDSVKLTSKTKTRALRTVAQLASSNASEAERVRARARREGWEGGFVRLEVEGLSSGEDGGIEEWVQGRALGSGMERWVKGGGASEVAKLRDGQDGTKIRSTTTTTNKLKLDGPTLRKSISLDNFGDARAFYLADQVGSTSSLV